MNHPNLILKVKECPQTEVGRIQALSYIFEDIQGL